MDESVNSSAKWFSTLSVDQRDYIKKLIKPISLLNGVPALFIVVWIVTGWGVITYPYWPIELLGSITMGFAIHALGICMHECAHGNMFRRPKLDYLMGVMCGAAAIVSMTAYKVTHIQHHKYNRTLKDPDEFSNITKHPRLLSIAFYAWVIIGMPVYLVHIVIISLQRGTPQQRRLVILEETFIVINFISIIVGSLYFDCFNVVLHCWIIPISIAMLLANCRSWSEHTMTRPGDPMLQSRTVISNKLVSLFLLNQNYHVEHHLFPAHPWYRLPTIHRLLQAEYKKANTFIYKSYTTFIWDACRNGVHHELPSLPERVRIWGATGPNHP